MGRTRKGLTLGINKDGNRVVYARLLNTGGQAIAFFGPQITESLDGAWRFELSPFSPPARAEVILAGELERKEYAFTLKAK